MNDTMHTPTQPEEGTPETNSPSPNENSAGTPSHMENDSSPTKTRTKRAKRRNAGSSKRVHLTGEMAEAMKQAQAFVLKELGFKLPDEKILILLMKRKVKEFVVTIKKYLNPHEETPNADIDSMLREPPS